MAASLGRRAPWLFLTIDGGKTWKRVHPDRLPFTTVATLPHAIVHLFGGPDGSLYATGAQGRQNGSPHRPAEPAR